MKKIFIFIIAAFVLVVIAFAAVKQYGVSLSKTNSPSTLPSAPTENKMNFTLKDLAGNTVSLEGLKGKRVFLNFWATWCPPCKAEMPDIEKLYQETKNSDLVIIAVNVGDPKETVQSFINKNKYHFTILLDLDNAVATQYNITGIPTSFFIDRDGNVMNHTVGALSYDAMKNNVDKLK